MTLLAAEAEGAGLVACAITRVALMQTKADARIKVLSLIKNGEVLSHPT